MTTPTAADLRPARLRLWSNWLWILAGILGLAVLWSGVRLIHDQQMRRAALRSLAQDKATEIANLGAARFSLLVANAFGPMWDDRITDPGMALAEMERVETRGTKCRCREMLPVSRFFRFDASTAAPFDAATQRLTSGARKTPDAIPDSTLVRIALRQFDQGMRVPTPIQSMDVIGTQAIFTITRPAGSGPGTKVYGAVMPVGDLAATLFHSVPLALPAGAGPRSGMTAPPFAHGPNAEMHARHLAEHRRLVQLDTFGLGVAADTQAIFGTLADRPYMATATLPPPLERFHVRVAMMGSHVALPLMMPVAQDRLWLNGVLILTTIVVCLFAIGASRREVALARARSDFVAGVSHDLRMPLAQILLASETLSLGRDRNEGERVALTGSIMREARRLKAMIDNVLLFSRSGAVGVEPHLQAVAVGPLFQSVVDSVALAVADAGQTIAVAAHHEVRVVADRALMHQALVNLVDNAIKYGPPGQRIVLSAGRSNSVVQLSVADEGPGIPAADCNRLFEPYERLARDSSSERTGSGLGLAVVRQIVVAGNGTIRIDDSDRGARVVIELPAAP